MITLRQIGAPRIVSSRRVVLDHPHETSDGVVVGRASPEGGVIVKIHKKTLKEVWRKKQRLKIRGGHDDLIFLNYGLDPQVWNNDAKLLWKPNLGFGVSNGRLLRWEDGEIEFIDPYTGKSLDRFTYPQGRGRLFIENARVFLIQPDELT